MPRPVDLVAVPSRFWEYRGAPRPVRPERHEKFHDALVAALRVAAGWPVDIRLRWSTGPRASVRLEAADRASVSWATSALFPVYPVGSWVPAVPDLRGRPPLRAVGRALHGVDRPFRHSSDLAAPWSDSVVAALWLLPPKAAVEWRFRPIGSPKRNAPVGSAPSAQPPGWRTPPPTETARTLDDARAARSIAPLWDLRAELVGRSLGDAESLGRLVSSAAMEDGGNGIAWRRATPWFYRSPRRIFVALDELAPWFPSPALRIPDPEWSGQRRGRSLPLGRTVSGRVCALPMEERQGRHLLLLGETGMGKSSLLVQLTVRAAAVGGVVFLDPIGDTSRRLLDRLPRSELPRVVWISPACSPVGVNALAPVAAGPPNGDRALGDLVQALRRVRVGRYADSPFWGPRVEEMLTLALRAAADYPGGTLREALALLAGAGGPLRGVPPGAEAAVQALAERVRHRPEEVDGARRVLGEVVGNPVLARMLSARGARFSVAEAVEAGRIVIVSGDATEVGEAASRTLLSVHLALLWLGLIARRRAAKTFVVADELQWYANDALLELFRLGRRFNVHLWAATQSLASLPESVREAAVTNSADLVVFRGSPEDAREVARWAPDLGAETVLGLRRGEAAVLIGKGREVGWVRLPFEPDRPQPERWSSVWQQCRTLWSDPPGAAAPAADDLGESRGTSSSIDPLRAVLLVLWAGFLAAGEADVLTVGVDGLREVADPSGATVRAAGQRLASAGALEVRNSEVGRIWTVRRDGVAALLGPGVGPEELVEADRRWERLRTTSAGSGAQKGL
ncbi:MAG: hypothetical protein L3K01_03105 [Thermoplasmata archaeon]|nr:hypothetical protein [Thermoplasmata archaeon]